MNDDADLFALMERLRARLLRRFRKQGFFDHPDLETHVDAAIAETIPRLQAMVDAGMSDEEILSVISVTLRVTHQEP